MTGPLFNAIIACLWTFVATGCLFAGPFEHVGRWAIFILSLLLAGAYLHRVHTSAQELRRAP